MTKPFFSHISISLSGIKRKSSNWLAVLILNFGLFPPLSFSISYPLPASLHLLMLLNSDLLFCPRQLLLWPRLPQFLWEGSAGALTLQTVICLGCQTRQDVLGVIPESTHEVRTHFYLLFQTPAWSHYMSFSNVDDLQGLRLLLNRHKFRGDVASREVALLPFQGYVKTSVSSSFASFTWSATWFSPLLSPCTPASRTYGQWHLSACQPLTPWLLGC